MDLLLFKRYDGRIDVQGMQYLDTPGVNSVLEPVTDGTGSIDFISSAIRSICDAYPEVSMPSKLFPPLVLYSGRGSQKSVLCLC